MRENINSISYRCLIDGILNHFCLDLQNLIYIFEISNFENIIKVKRQVILNRNVHTNRNNLNIVEYIVLFSILFWFL